MKMLANSDRVVVVDGGFSTQLSLHVGPNIDGHPLWSARFNAINPEAVTQSHLDFLLNGAEIIMANTYQASIEGYSEHLNLSREQSIDLIKSTVKLAHDARDKFLSSKDKIQQSPLIFASIGPYGAHLHDGSEYNGAYATKVSAETIKKWHKVRIDACLEAGVDGLGIETMPCKMEADALVDMILEEYPGVKFWISFQCKDEKSLANGEDFSTAVESVWNKVEARGNKNLLAIGVNCVNPNLISKLFQSITIKMPLLAVPNSGEIYSADNGWQGKTTCIPLEDYISEWIKLGARYIGGCCRTNADDIKRIRAKIESLPT